MRDSYPYTDFTAVTIGSFDGYHRGHSHILTLLSQEAKKRGLHPVVVTFEPHPRVFFRHSFSLLSTLEEKIWLFQNYSPVSTLLVKTFNQHLANLSANSFIERFLVEELKARLIIIGFNHRFGKGREGDISLLKEYASKGFFEVQVISPVMGEKEIPISSSLIRKMMYSGHFHEAISFLGHPYVMIGRVVPGEGIGKTLGFPTANLEFSNPYKLIPQDGVYVASVEWKGKTYPAAVSIGIRPTLHGTRRQFEVYILNFQEDLYGKELVVLLHHKLRDQIKFATVRELIQQMEKDVEAVEDFFFHGTHSNS